MSPRKFRRDDPVSFEDGIGEVCGYVASLESRSALIVLDDGRAFNVPVCMLKQRRDVKPRRVRTRNDAARMEFAENDHVSFFDSRQIRRVGHIVKINPKYARVKRDDKTWQVPYINLKHEGDATIAIERRTRLTAIESEAVTLLKKHELSNWRFRFDQAMRRCGRCAFDQQEISLSEQFAQAASEDEVTDTILHEVAHALVGPKHGHDRIWKATAQRIGCTGRVTHNVDFSTARWILTCTSCGWREPRLRRRRGLICKSCGRAVEYQPNGGSTSTSDN